MKQTQVLIIGYVWPEPNSSAAGTRMMELIELFQQQQWQVTFASPAQDSEHMADLASLRVKKVSITLNDESFDHYISELQPDIVMFDRFMMEEQFGWRVEQCCPNALRILDTEDLHSLRDARHTAFKKSREVTAQDLSSDIALREIAAIQRCDLSLIISSYEMELLQNHYKVDGALLHHLPFMLDPQHLKRPRLSFEQRVDFVSIGNFRHAPNWDAVRYLKESIWPLIRQQLPQANLHIYGAYPPPKATALHNPKQGFHVKGWAKDAHEVIGQARVCLAPIRFGAGIKGKLADSMLNGTPSVTTSIGSEAMHHNLPWSGAISNDPQTFAYLAVHLYNNLDAWQQAVVHGDSIIYQQYNKTTLGNKLIRAISQTIDSLEQHRLANFTGMMLRHHAHKSTKYMAQWIEAKNKLPQQ
ncbi:glycosyltransferase family 4 protein [Psychrobium sp. 1_MG-2023]|uniref:glycosyltransferase n=1 Tax=Psychrobium sp. 1_MG-2023 TaxID=3062624 RepID=UPI000C331D39|nr:glycosyltransferase family 4 protein [Psychrobium sp. 1_MG-2023]MDP2560197.1 glycosyltransferase family 4 protein [Psychrobium sp. 1_MG-2023]PKF57008.1 glycosyltransferase [Alteromonadales bacterium alter-6D02]